MIEIKEAPPVYKRVCHLCGKPCGTEIYGAEFVRVIEGKPVSTCLPCATKGENE